MAGDRHGKHNTTTISFRVNSYEKATIEERVKVSGMKKQDYIVRSCIYNHVCVVGKKETIEIIFLQSMMNRRYGLLYVSFWRNGAIRIIDKYEGRDVS